MSGIVVPVIKPDFTDEELADALDQMFNSCGLTLCIDGLSGCWNAWFIETEKQEVFGKRVFFSRALDREHARQDVYCQTLAILEEIFGDTQHTHETITRH